MSCSHYKEAILKVVEYLEAMAVGGNGHPSLLCRQSDPGR